MMTKEELTAALAVWAGDDEDKKKQAADMIAELYPDEAGDDVAEEETKASEDASPGDEKKTETKAAEPPPPPAKDEKEKAKATRAPVTLDTATAVRLEALERELADRRKDDETKEREAIFASRPDISAGLKKIYASAKPSTIAAVFAAIEVPKGYRANAHVQTTSIVRGAGQIGSSDQAIRASRTSEHADELDQRMGLAASRPAIRREGNAVVFGVMSPADARAAIAAKKGAVVK